MMSLREALEREGQAMQERIARFEAEAEAESEAPTCEYGMGGSHVNDCEREAVRDGMCENHAAVTEAMEAQYAAVKRCGFCDSPAVVRFGVAYGCDDHWVEASLVGE